jgi:hypothetical protein
MRLFDRYYELHIANKVMTVDDLDIFFRVTGSANEAATAEITVYNLSESTIKAIESGSPLILIAGYRGDYGIIFQGTVKRAELTIEGADLAAEIVAVDNLTELQKQIRITTPEGTDLSDIAKQVFQQAGIPVGKIEQTGVITTKPMTFKNSGMQTLDTLANDADFQYYVKDGKGYFVAKDSKYAETIVISSDTVLLEVCRVDEQDQQQEKYKLKSLLIWKTAIDTRIKLESIKIKGQFKVSEYEHCCLGEEYFSEMEVVPI